jgi:hypothetical protein
MITSAVSNTQLKAAERSELARMTEEYLAKGGEIPKYGVKMKDYVPAYETTQQAKNRAKRKGRGSGFSVSPDMR